MARKRTRKLVVQVAWQLVVGRTIRVPLDATPEQIEEAVLACTDGVRSSDAGPPEWFQTVANDAATGEEVFEVG